MSMKNKQDEIAISVKGVSKSFKLPHEKQSSIKSVFVNAFNGKRTYEKQKVLKDISFDIKKGEFFGIVGRNGSGKSTLLKLISGIYTPDKGKININGKLVPFIELGVGFNPELSGRDNVFLNGALLGFSQVEMDEMYDEIVEFAELERFMDQKLKNYSSGMQVRLAFSIAIRAKADILVLDEVLAVGDYNFQQKCYEYFRHLKKIKKTVILVSHDAGAIQSFCSKVLLVENGEIKARGKSSDVLRVYTDQNTEDQQKLAESQKETSSIKIDKGSGSVALLSIHTSCDNKKTKVFKPNQTITINIKVKFNENVDNPVFGLVINDSEGGMPIFATNTLDGGLLTGNFNKGDIEIAKFNIKNRFNDGKYIVSGAVASSDRVILHTRFMSALEFSSSGWNNTAKSRVYSDYIFSIEGASNNE